VTSDKRRVTSDKTGKNNMNPFTRNLPFDFAQGREPVERLLVTRN